MAHFKRNEKRMKRLIILDIISLVNVKKKKSLMKDIHKS